MVIPMGYSSLILQDQQAYLVSSAYIEKCQNEPRYRPSLYNRQDEAVSFQQATGAKTSMQRVRISRIVKGASTYFSEDHNQFIVSWTAEEDGEVGVG